MWMGEHSMQGSRNQMLYEMPYPSSCGWPYPIFRQHSFSSEEDDSRVIFPTSILKEGSYFSEVVYWFPTEKLPNTIWSSLNSTLCLVIWFNDSFKHSLWFKLHIIVALLILSLSFLQIPFNFLISNSLCDKKYTFHWSKIIMNQQPNFT